jgi:hypothetical protein
MKILPAFHSFANAPKNEQTRMHLQDGIAWTAQVRHHTEHDMTHLIEAAKVAFITKQNVSLQAVLIIRINASTDT